MLNFDFPNPFAIFNNNKTTMQKWKHSLFFLIVQLAILLLLLDYHLNPKLLQTQCITAQSITSNNVKIELMDCITCHQIDRNALRDKFIGFLSVSVPRKQLGSSNANSRLPLDNNLGISSPAKKKYGQSLNYAAKLFVQDGCSDFYECKTFLVPEDFSLQAITQASKAVKLNIQQNYNFELQASNFLTHFSSTLMFQSQDIIFQIQTSSLSLQAISSIILKLRYDIQSQIDGQKQPAVMIYQLQTGLFIRLLLVLITLVSYSRLVALITDKSNTIKIMLLASVLLGFISSYTMIAASIVVVNLTLIRFYELGKYSMISSILFAATSYCYLLDFIPLGYPFAVVLAYILLVCFKMTKEQLTFLGATSFVLIVFYVCYMWMLEWDFFIFYSPLLVAVNNLTLKQEKQLQKSIKYDLIHFNDDEEDVLSKIERELR